ncbi:MAG: M56 family metallopeptidase, partial [Terriglobus sp.]
NTHGHVTTVTITEAHFHQTSTNTSGPSRGWDVPLWLSLHVMRGIVAFWLLTALYAAARLLVGIHRTRRLVNAAQPYALQPDEAQLWRYCTQQFGLKNTRVLESAQLQSPVAGAQNQQHILLLPANFFASVSTQDAQSALAHEAAHMQRNDYRINIALHAAAMVIFFHPFTLLLRRQLAASREMACDHAASVQIGSANTYRLALLRLAIGIAQGRPIPQMSAAIGIFDSHSLEDRLNRLEKNMLTSNTAVRYALATIAFVGITATASALALNGMRLLPSVAESNIVSPIAHPTPTREPASSPEPDRLVRAVAQPKGKLIMPVLIRQVDPIYPESARINGSAGRTEHNCIVAITVDTNGVPQNVHIAHSGGEDFDANSIAAVSQYRFKPATQSGKPVAADMKIEVNFQIF